MNFERCKRGLGSNRRGVSEVVGNILILMITVILFSAIVAYVNQIPVPETTTKADFAASVTFETNVTTTTASLTVTHAGGVVLDADETAVYIQAGNSTYFDILSEDDDFSYTRWTTGTDWTKSFEVASEATQIIVTVIDLDKDTAVWSSQVSGGAGGTPPIILQRYLDSNTTSPTADPVKQSSDGFSFFVKVIDLDNDLDTSTSGVWIDSSQLPNGTSMDTYEESTDEGWFRFDFGAITSNVALIDNKIIKIHAKDTADHETVSSFVVTVTILPSDQYYLPSQDPQFEGGVPSWLSHIGNGQGWGTFKQNLSTGLYDKDQPTNTFEKDQIVFVVAASTKVSSLMGANELTLLDPLTNTEYVPLFSGSSTASAPFYIHTVIGDATLFLCQFSTSSLPPGAYELSFVLKGAGTGAASFVDDGPLYLWEMGSPITFMPKVWVYSTDAARTAGSPTWGARTTPFDVTGAPTSTLYVSVEVQDAEDVPSPVIEDIRIADMDGDTQLHGTPPSGDMITAWEANTVDPYNHTYEFEIDLRLNNGDQWISGINSYTLKITRFSDANEGVYSLSCKFNVRAATARADFLVGAAGFMTGTSNFVNPAYLYYIQNNNFFTKRTMYDYANAPSAADNYATSALALGDIDGDGDLDVLMGQYNSHSLYYIENSLNTFGTWQEASQMTRPSADDTEADINWIATGDINGDGDIDFAYSTHNTGGGANEEGRTVVIYNNTYGATGYLWQPPDTGGPGYNDTNDGVRKIALEDMTGDGRDDLIVLAEGRIWIYNLQEWDSTEPIAVIPYYDDSSNILDFDIADVDGDGHLDVVTVDSDASSEYRGVYVWYYAENTSPDEVVLDDTDNVAHPTVGQAINMIGDTHEEGGLALQLRENSSALPIPRGELEVDLTTDTLSSDVYQQLRVRVKVTATGGLAEEGFYIWYSIDGDKYTPIIFVPGTQSEYAYYTRELPSKVAGQVLTIRITDTLKTNESASPVETLHLDYLAILTGTFGSYEPQAVINTHEPLWQSVSLGNINGVAGDNDYGLEVIVARDGEDAVPGWMVYNRTSTGPDVWTALDGWSGGDETFFARGNTKIDLHSSMASDETPIRNILVGSSPRLFKVVDVNGDNFDDIVVVNYTLDDDITSQVALHLNIHGSQTSWLYYVVKDIAADYQATDVRGGITWLEVGNLVPS
ncbi:MAG: VCBS repeat-containing protein [Methanobacteriota archaeon]|nr:MAG: VCBS repeat-containing protein [Euryarchaeota archaeon]